MRVSIGFDLDGVAIPDRLILVFRRRDVHRLAGAVLAANTEIEMLPGSISADLDRCAKDRLGAGLQLAQTLGRGAETVSPIRFVKLAVDNDRLCETECTEIESAETKQANKS